MRRVRTTKDGRGGGGFEAERRTVVGILQNVFGAENVFASLADWRVAEDRRRKDEAEALRHLRRQFEYELSVLKKVAADEGMAAGAAMAAGDEEEAVNCAFRAWHVARLITRGEQTGKRVWAWDVVGRCLLEAGVKVPSSFIISSEIREMIERASRRALTT